MKRLLPILLVAAALPAWGQSMPAPYQIADNNAAPPPGTPPPAEKTNAAPALSQTPPARASHAPADDRQATIDHLTKSNQELLDLLKKQQAVLEDIQYDRRLQNRQISLIEARLEDTLQANAALQAKVAKLQAEAAAASTHSTASAGGNATPMATSKPIAAVSPAPPPPPATYLPAPETAGAPGTMWWHRLLTMSGDDSKNSGTFHITGKQWRVVWHNLDRPGAAYKNTSALFINAFPKGDTIPKKVCSQLGTGSDKTEMTGEGAYYLKIEASGGHWEAAVEDFCSGPAAN